MSDLVCRECGHDNLGSANFCSSCGAPLPKDDVTTDLPVVDLESDGTVEIDRSEFGPHEGLFVVPQGPKAGARYALDADVVTVGRHPDSDIFLDDITVSRRHAEVRREGARYWVRDVGSLNGTYVNRERADDRELADGDELQVGKFKLVFVHGTGAG
ncbi:MAG: FHA domain-containing protein [Acidimicrobiales bacterium]|nr:FHA domain-containing protein [Acidimicrobiales bacterium]